jgi:hypothetical protein
MILLVTNHLVGVHSVERDDFVWSVGKDLEESVRRLFQLSALAVAAM